MTARAHTSLNLDAQSLLWLIITVITLLPYIIRFSHCCFTNIREARPSELADPQLSYFVNRFYLFSELPGSLYGQGLLQGHSYPLS